MTRVLLLSLITLAAARSAHGDILSWQDAEGVRHFTNHKEDVPPEFRDRATVAVRDYGYDSSAPTKAVDGGANARSQPARARAEVVYDQPPPSQEYVAGLERGVELARRRELIDQVVQSVTPVVIAPHYPISPWSGHSQTPVVSSGFDNGRFRHRTLRMWMQDQMHDDCSHLDPWYWNYGTTPLPTTIVIRDDHSPRDRRRAKRLLPR